MAADVAVFDADTIDRGREEPAFDVPGAGMRYVGRAKGVNTVPVDGEVAYSAGAYAEAKTSVVSV